MYGTTLIQSSYHRASYFGVVFGVWCSASEDDEYAQHQSDRDREPEMHAPSANRRSSAYDHPSADAKTGSQAQRRDHDDPYKGREPYDQNLYGYPEGYDDDRYPERPYDDERRDDGGGYDFDNRRDNGGYDYNHYAGGGRGQYTIDHGYDDHRGSYYDHEVPRSGHNGAAHLTNDAYSDDDSGHEEFSFRQW